MAARRFIEAGEAAAAAAIADIRATVLDTEDAKEGIRSFVERRPAVFRGT
jgi:enoyl-CoA hydratase/carnithine racemase